MKVIYFSVSGNCSIFAHNLNAIQDDLIELTEDNSDLMMNDDFIIIVPTYDEYLTTPIFAFLENNHLHCKGIVGSGNRNFGDEGYIFTAKDLNKKFNIPIIHDFEYAGFNEDVCKVNDFLEENK